MLVDASACTAAFVELEACKARLALAKFDCFKAFQTLRIAYGTVMVKYLKTAPLSSKKLKAWDRLTVFGMQRVSEIPELFGLNNCHSLGISDLVKSKS